jgi:hypothetical protein
MSVLIFKQDIRTTTIIVKGTEYTVLNTHPKLQEMKQLVIDHGNSKVQEQRDAYENSLTELVKSPYRHVIEKDERFEIDTHGNIYLNGVSDPIPHQLGEMIKDYIDNTIDLEPLVNFWMLLSRNPDPRVKSQLFSFLEHNGHPITSHGYFVAYKSVAFSKKFDKQTGKEILSYDENTGEIEETTPTSSMVFKPHHSGPHGNIIKVGEPVTMPRNECDSNPNNTCSTGLHVGSMAYVGDFGHSEKVILECLINPRNVVAVPTDYNNTKMRVCEYYPLSVATGENPDIFLASDYKNYEKEEVTKELAERKKIREEVISQIVARAEEHENVLNSLY